MRQMAGDGIITPLRAPFLESRPFSRVTRSGGVSSGTLDGPYDLLGEAETL